MLSKEEYLEQKKNVIEFELANIPKFYAKITIQWPDRKNNIEYYDSFDVFTGDLIEMQTKNLMFHCELISELEYDENYLPF